MKIVDSYGNELGYTRGSVNTSLKTGTAVNSAILTVSTPSKTITAAKSAK